MLQASGVVALVRVFVCVFQRFPLPNTPLHRTRLLPVDLSSCFRFVLVPR